MIFAYVHKDATSKTLCPAAILNSLCLKYLQTTNKEESCELGGLRKPIAS